MPVFSNSLELVRRMVKLGADRELMEASFDRLEEFKRRFRDERYMLMSSKQLDRDEAVAKRNLAETLAQVTSTPKAGITFLRLDECRAMPREKQLELYEHARANSLRSNLNTDGYRRFANLKDETGRMMHDVVHGAIGTRRLTLALDNTFGNAFANVLKHDIVALWITHFMSFEPPGPGKLPEPGRVKATGDMVKYITKVLPAAYLPELPAQWIVLTA